MPLYLASTRVGWARVLTARGGREDLDRARQMLERAEEAAALLGAIGIVREVACRLSGAAISK